MTNEEILYKVIEKAQKNNWYSNNKFKIVHFNGSIGTSMKIHGNYKEDGIIENWERDAETLIFNNYFAKAFFREENWFYGWIKRVDDKVTKFPTGWQWFPESERKLNTLQTEIKMCIPAWEYHLQQMVLQEDPIKYLEQFI